MVKHVLKDGTVLDDISGHIVKVEDVKQVYEILGRVSGGNSYEKDGRENSMQFLA